MLWLKQPHRPASSEHKMPWMPDITCLRQAIRDDESGGIQTAIGTGQT
ncbi:hypothetical protein D3OALGA1CA_4310 [Olavius algarvensis associated proteobacterium Delta 3]|nr:hypothetical protein D3OALGB2SA_121 [Olavius algarvensis associated proteobacterium Delta 3]CAB5148929.1 hypothetical protein D3OALGA1CA_4310 [Olavius algarvensis associated proteobacterium Delta 3]